MEKICVNCQKIFRKGDTVGLIRKNEVCNICFSKLEDLQTLSNISDKLKKKLEKARHIL